MKRTLILGLFILMFQITFAQVAYFGAGYNVANGSFNNLNSIIDSYNDANALTTDMKKFGLNHGMTFDFGMVMPYFSFSFGLQYIRAKTHSNWVTDGVKYQRDIYLRCFNWPLDFGLNIDSGSFAIDPGVGVNFMFWRYLSRKGEKDDIDDIDFFKSNSSLNMHVKFFTRFVFGGFEETGFGFVLEPYYNLGFIGSALDSFSSTLTGNYFIDKTENFSTYGLRAYVIIKG